MIKTLRAGSYLEFVLEMIMFSVKTSVFVEAQIYKSDPIFIFPVLFLKFDFLNMKLLFFFLNCWKGTRIQKASDSTQCSWTLAVAVCNWPGGFEPLILGLVSGRQPLTKPARLSPRLFDARPLTLPAVFLSSQAWSCWLSGCGGRWAWRPISLWRLRRAPMHHMSSSGPEPSSLFSDCSDASLRAAAARGCSNWSVKCAASLPEVFLSHVTLCDCLSLYAFCSTPCFWPWCSWLSLLPVFQALSSDMRWVSHPPPKKIQIYLKN